MVQDLIIDNRSTIVCLQETKLASIDAAIIRDTLGPKFVQNYTYLSAQQTRGGALLAVDEDYYKLSGAVLGEFTTSTKLEATTTPQDWWLTEVNVAVNGRVSHLHSV